MFFIYTNIVPGTTIKFIIKSPMFAENFKDAGQGTIQSVKACLLKDNNRYGPICEPGFPRCLKINYFRSLMSTGKYFQPVRLV